MAKFYLTPSAITYFSQFLLTFVLNIYFVWRYFFRKKENIHFASFIFFICGLTIFSLLLFLETASLPTQRLYFVYMENPTLALTLVALYIFIYRFPTAYPSRTMEGYFFLALSLMYAGYEFYYAAYRLSDLTQGNVNYRSNYADYALAALLILIPILFLRQASCADSSARPWWKKLWKPAALEQNAALQFALTALVPLGLGLANILRGQSALSTAYFNALLSAGMLVTLFLLVLLYLHSVEENISLFDKTLGVTLTLLFMIASSIGLALTPNYLQAMTILPADVASGHSLRFTPNGAGYTVAQIPFAFESELGQELPVTARGQERNYGVDFPFPFFGVTYSRVYVTSVGLVKMGSELFHPNLQYHYGRIPAIFPLLIDLEPEGPGGVFARVEADRLIVTWSEIAPLHRPGVFFTFQTILYRDGRFDFNYKTIPPALIFLPDGSVSANPWLRGATPGGTQTPQLTADLLRVNQMRQAGILQDFNLKFRQDLHQFLAPLFKIIIFSALLIFLLLPMLLYRNIGAPLNALMNGVKAIESGNLNVTIATQSRDEIGVLSRAFNGMTILLKRQIDELEYRVRERTDRLTRANLDLHSEIESRQAAQASLLEKERALAIAEERERLSRALHDGLAQSLSAIVLEASEAQREMEAEKPAAGEYLTHIHQLALGANRDLRNFIFTLRADKEQPAPELRFSDELQAYLNAYQKSTGIQVERHLPDALAELHLGLQTRLGQIIREALTNVRKHAQARRVDIFLQINADGAHLMVTDNGVGFDANARPPSAGDYHFGLDMIRERAESWGGSLKILSTPGEGTRLSVFLPLLTAANDTLTRLRLLLVDDSPIFLDGLRTMLSARGLNIVGAAADGLEAQEKVRLLRPDVVLMDLHMPRCDGLQATAVIKEEFPAVKVLILTTAEDGDSVIKAIQRGADGFIPKTTNLSNLIKSIGQLAVKNEVIVSPQMAVKVVSHLADARRKERKNVESLLSGVDLEIFTRVGQGLTYKEVAESVRLAERTVKYHVKKILECLQLRNHAQLVEYYQKLHQQD